MQYFNALEDRYKTFAEKQPVDQLTLGRIENALSLKLPGDFRKIATFYSGGFLGGKSHNAITLIGPGNNIVDETLRLRAEIGLPHQFIVIAEPPESLIVLDTSNQGSKVIWCDAPDVRNLANLEILRKPDIWASYYDFFEYLLQEEEDERAEQ
jgi:hypothetical protein